MQIEGAVAASSTARSGPHDSLPYAFGANRRNQPKTTDLVPKRVLSFSLVVVALALCLGLLNALAVYAPTWKPQLGEAGVEVLLLSGRGTLASWFSSFLLIITGLASLQIYALRQHRRDDYRGTYRLWIWMAGLFLVASMSCVVDLPALAGNLLKAFSPVSFSERPWLAFSVKMLLLSTLVARGLFEVRTSRGTFACVVLVWIAYSAAAIMQLPAVQPAMVQLNSDLTMGNCLLLATTGLLLTHLTYARFIYLQANQLIQPRAAKSKAAKSTVDRSAQPTAKTGDPEEAKTLSQKIKTRLKKKRSPQQASDLSGDHEDSKREIASRETASSANDTKSKSKAAAAKSGKATREQEVADQEDDGVIRMSKAERRRQRKQEQRRCAA